MYIYIYALLVALLIAVLRVDHQRLHIVLLCTLKLWSRPFTVYEPVYMCNIFAAC
jgi:hypothetical protein